MIRMYVCLVFALLFASDVFSDGLYKQKIGNSYHVTGTVNGQNVDYWESPFLNGTQKHGTIGGQSVNTYSQPFLNGAHEHGTIGGQSVNTYSQPFLNGTQTHGTIGGQNVNMHSQPFLNGVKTHGTIGGQNVDTYSQPFLNGVKTHGTWGNQYDRSFRQRPVVSPLPQKTFGVQHDNAYRIPAAGNLNAHSAGGWSCGTDVDYHPSSTYFDKDSSTLGTSSLPHYDYERPRSLPVIEGYKYIGEDNQIGNSSFGDAVENAAIQAACYYGAKALVKAFGDGNEAFSDRNKASTPIGHDSSYRQFEKKSWGLVRWISLIFHIIALALVVGFVLVRMGNKKLLHLLESLFDKEEYGRRCVTWRNSHTRRDPQGCLVSVEMPTALRNLIYGIYAICALPWVVVLWKIDWCNFKIAWNSYSWMVLVGCVILMALPVSLHRGKILARGVVVFICVALIVCFALMGLMCTFAENDGSALFVMLIIFVVMMSFFCYLILILVSPSTDEWLRMKKELRLENSRRRVMAVKAMGHRIITSRAWLFVEKSYIWIAVVLILICFVVIFRGLFSPLSSNALDAEKRRMMYGRHEGLKQIESPDNQGPSVLP